MNPAAPGPAAETSAVPASASAATPAHALTLVLVLHDHQPNGNFDHVFASAFRDAYAPFLEFLEAHPALRLALHTSGPLLEWLDAHEPGYLDRLRDRVAAGQIEPWGGAFYEPILPAIPERDRQGQIVAMADWIERRLGQRPRGLWLAERVWEPGLASSLAAAGVEYTAVDDAHFVAAGFERDALWGTFLTEDQGLPLRLFPIHRELRYQIPFGAPEEVVATLARVANGGSDRVAVLGDDGEKFGLWPGTRRLCYDERWLARFVRALADAPWIRLRTPAEAIEAHAPLGLAYLPSGSYHEMQEWALPPAAQSRYHAAARALESLEPKREASREAAAESTPVPEGAPAPPAEAPAAPAGEAHDLLRGGHWRNFLARYPESNRLHKRMLRASRRLSADERPDDPAWREARTRMWRAQCNCPYWHGVFGGLYLPHLRAAAYRELIAAESWRAREGVERGDLDLDGWDDALLETSRWAAWISARGGRLWGFDDRRALWNWGDTLAQRREHYHDDLERAEVGDAGGAPAKSAGPVTIHAGVRLKEPGLAARVSAYRSHDRDSLLDSWHEAGRDADWSGGRAMLSVEAGAVVARCPEGVAPAIEKRFAAAGGAPGAAGSGGLEVTYTLHSGRARRGTLAVELNLALHVREAEDRWIEIDGRRADPPAPGAEARHAQVTRSAFVDAWAGRRLDLESDRPADLTRAPIETVSLSESGAERVFQGVEARYAFPVELAAGSPWSLRLQLRPGTHA